MEIKKYYNGMEVYKEENVEGEPAQKPRFLQRVNSGLTALGNKYKAYKAAAPQRQEAKLKKLQYNTKVQMLKEQQASSRFRVQRQNIDLMERKQRAMGPMPSMFGGMGGGMGGGMRMGDIGKARPPSIMIPAPSLAGLEAAYAPAKRAPAKKRTVHRKRRVSHRRRRYYYYE